MKIYKFYIFITVILLSAGALAKANWVSDVNTSSKKQLKPLISDIGNTLGGGLFQNALPLAFPGASLRFETSLISINDDNDLISDDNIFVPYISLHAAIPKNISVFVRGMKVSIADSSETLNFTGGGFTYTLMQEEIIPFKPAIISFIALNTLKTNNISIETSSIGCVVSKKLPFLQPYLAISYDITRSSLSTLIGTVKPSNNELRYGGGFNMKLLYNLSLNAEATNLGYNAGLDLSVGLPG